MQKTRGELSNVKHTHTHTHTHIYIYIYICRNTQQSPYSKQELRRKQNKKKFNIYEICVLKYN